MDRVIWTLPAIEELEHIAEYISLDAPFRASMFVVSIIQSVEKLIDFPKLGRIIPEKNDPLYREIIFGNYRIMYRILSDTIEVLSVFHSSRNFNGSLLS